PGGAGPTVADSREPRAQRQLTHRGGGSQPASPGAWAPLGARVSRASGSRAGRRARAPLEGRRRMRLVVVTGVSGAGKSTALRALEDLGYYAVDNLPLALLAELLELLNGRPDVDRVTLGFDPLAGV